MDQFASFDMKLKKQAFTKVKKEQSLSLMGEYDLLSMPPKKEKDSIIGGEGASKVDN